MEKRPVPKTFEEWLEHLKKKSPGIQWDLMSESAINELRQTYEDGVKSREDAGD